METGAITGYIDVAQLVLYGFWIFFAGLIFYLRREDKREGFPLESERSRFIDVVGFPRPPGPKTFLLGTGRQVTVPRPLNERELAASPAMPWPGAPLEPTGNPLLDGVGPASYALREDVPDKTVEGENRIMPLRALPEYGLVERDPDPRGFAVVGADGVSAGRVLDVWVDRADPMVRYLEIEGAAPSQDAETVGEAMDGSSPATHRTLVPMNFAHIRRGGEQVVVKALLGAQISAAPGLASPDQVTLREEDRLAAYFAGGMLYASPGRAEPLL